MILKICISLVLLIGVSSALPIANVYSGTVYIFGATAPSGTIVTAFVDDIQLPYNSTVNQEGRYNLQMTGETGQTVKFYIDEKIADQTDIISINNTDTFDPYVIKNLDLSLTVINTQDGGNSGGGSSGGGGGSGTSGEGFSNIEIKEKYDLHIFKDIATSFAFTSNKNPIMFIIITGNINAGKINTAIEVLKDTSTLIKTKAPGSVYKNVNIWVGTSGYATSKNIQQAVIKFKVDNAWMNTNGFSKSDVIMMKWDGNTWLKLETSGNANDGTYTYYEAKTQTFSSFAIIGLKEEKSESVYNTVVVTETPANPTSTPTTTVPKRGIPGFEIVTVIAVIYLVVRRRK